MNPFLCGHIVFLTTVAAAQPTPLAGAYNATVTRNGNSVGRYLVRVGAALAPPVNADLDASISSSLTGAGGWTNATVTGVTVDGPTGDRIYNIDVFEAPAGLVAAGDTAGVVVRFTVKRVEPRTS